MSDYEPVVKLVQYIVNMFHESCLNQTVTSELFSEVFLTLFIYIKGTKYYKQLQLNMTIAQTTDLKTNIQPN